MSRRRSRSPEKKRKTSRSKSPEKKQQSSTINEKFTSLMRKMNLPVLPLSKDAVISGSATWWMLTSDEKTTWLPNDVDVYIKRSAVKDFRQFLNDNGGYLVRCQEIDYGGDPLITEEWRFFHPVQKIEPTFWEMHNEKFKLSEYPEHVNCCMRDINFAISTSTVQLVIPMEEVESPTQMITGKFDLPTLESFYDGTTMSLSNKKDIDDRISVVREQHSTKSLRADRIKKYKSRGLAILTNGKK